MKHRFLYRWLIAMAFTMVWASTSHAVTTDLLYGTSLTNKVSVKYTDVVGSTTFDTDDSINTTVAGIAGDTLTAPADGSIAGAGGSDTVTYTVYNTGNRAETFAVGVGLVTYDGGADSWDFRLATLTTDGTFQSSIDSGAQGGGTVFLSPVGEDATATFILVIRSSTTQANAPDGSHGTFTLVVYSSANDSAASQIVVTTEYTGDNGNLYAEGDRDDTDKVAAAITAPSVTVTKAITSVTSPSGDVSGAVIPGAELTYTIGIHNNGNGNAKNIIVFDTVPFTTTPGDLVEFDSMVKNANFTAYWATDATASRVYVGAADTQWFAFVGSPPAAHPGTDTGTVRFIKWENADFASGSDTVTFKVTVN